MCVAWAPIIWGLLNLTNPSTPLSPIRGVVDSGCITGSSSHLDRTLPLAAGNSIYNFRRCVCRANVRQLPGSAASPSVILVGWSLGVDVRTTVLVFDADNNRHPNSATSQLG